MRRSVVLIALAGTAAAFSPSAPTIALRGSRPSVCRVNMGKQAAEGPFSPIVRAVRGVLGDGTLTKVRGDVIAKHSAVRESK